MASIAPAHDKQEIPPWTQRFILRHFLLLSSVCYSHLVCATCIMRHLSDFITLITFLRSRLVMDYTTSYFPLIMLGYHLDSNHSYGPLSDTVSRCLIFPAFEVTRSLWTNHRRCYISLWCPWESSHVYFANKNWLLPVPTYRSTWVVLWLLFFRSAPSMFPNKWSTHRGPFPGVPSR